MRSCQTCIHSIPIFVTSNIYTDGYSQVCRDCKAKRKDGYEPIYDEEKKMTNAEKFKEVFGIYPAKANCPLGMPCSKCNYKHRQGCSYHWWNEEYKENKE